MTGEDADILVIGAGIAGCSVAAELAADAKVIVLEGESQPGYHSTGRSAAYFDPSYGNPVVRGLTRASEHFFRQPPAGFTEARLLRPRDCLYLARHEQLAKLRAMQAEDATLEWLGAASVMQEQPLVSADYIAAALRDAHGGDLDVDAILQGYLRLFRARGGRLFNGEMVTAIEHVSGHWEVRTANSLYRADIVVDAAGAWADPIAELAGLGGVGIGPRRRTALLIDMPAGYKGADWPMIVDVEENFYFKPDAGQLLISPADETPSPPCDAQADELDVAVAVDWFQRVTGESVRRVNHRWAGLRSFAPDKTFVIGFDPRAQGFFWLAGQGGYGVQSAPAVAQLARALIIGSPPAQSFAGVLVHEAAVTPGRLLE
jgi:D-arginine dehydrogenase